MIVRFRVVRKDTKALIQSAKITLEKGESVGITNAVGEADIVTYYSGNLMYSVEATGYMKVSGTVQVPTTGNITFVVELGAFVAPSVPAPPGEDAIGTVGTSCDLLQKSMFGQSWYSYRNRYTGVHWVWDSERGDAEHAAETDVSCFAPPPPPPKTADEVSKDVDILRGTIQGVSSRIQDLTTAFTGGLSGISSRIDEIQKGIDGIWAQLEGWLVERILGIIWKALTAEKKEEA